MASPNRDGPRVPGVKYGIAGSRSRSMGSGRASGTGAPRTVSAVTSPRHPWAHAVKDKTEAAHNRMALAEQRQEVMERWASFCYGTVNFST